MPDFPKKFMQENLKKLALKAAQAGITSEVFESLLIELADEMNFAEIIHASKKEPL
ncbi:MAG: hypothetical protein ACRCVY_04740 [Commensalibacter sp.]